MAWKILLAGAIAWLIAQFLKFIIEGIKKKKFNPRTLYAPGGMPSGHTATMVAVTTMIYFLEGFSNLFYLALFVTIIIIYDAVTVRRQVGIITKALNGQLKNKIRYFEGHTVPQTIIGLVIGMVVAYLVWFL